MAGMTLLAGSPLGAEALDDPRCPDALVRSTLGDITLVNRLFGGRAAAAYGLDRLLSAGPVPRRRLTLLDVGAGAGDVATWLIERAAARGLDLAPVTLDRHRAAAGLCAAAGLPAVVAGVEALPFRDRGVDLVLASQFLHHFSREAAVDLVGVLTRLAGLGVIVAEPRRSAGALAGIWVASHALGLHPVTRRDGVLSVRRSFTTAELGLVLARAGVSTPVWRRPGFRLTAAWRTDRAHG
jgi:SAM-dependent methyltransferase